VVGGALARYNVDVPERPEPDLDRVVDAMRRHDEAESPPRLSHGPSELQDGVQVVALDPEGEERFQLLRRQLGVSAFGLNLLRFRPGQRGRIHRHERQEEVYLVLEGTLTLGVEGEERELARGDLARVAPSVRRQLTNRGSELLLVLSIGGDGAHDGRDGVAYTAWEDGEGRPPAEVPLPPDLEV
jgi:mannose-6-phosphate isomerase-like protein (cupin superfamily)